MGDIYRGCDCSISAMASRDASGGIFVTRNSLDFIPCSIKGEDSELLWEGSDRMFSGTRREDYEQLRIFSQPLSNRGWVLQEQTLSPWTIQFTSRALV
jgi:hypothetical protein